ncbi:DUF1428 domain-containing protein [Paracoccus sp. (in: a-proteobacteria)]|uniref:DUF1428 domain-containing protein n=1 Tax=Paracoccus sp. TaxID=267 RepID=UPI0026E0197E|nr:DUF1428 domain-containing protein [Paracoccus sp. (in: a-proteobacteria)]MDO5369017.1 DUF1428 domain-containing protein [Paracoccus sp. (in: a-proteobacteria)]
MPYYTGSVTPVPKTSKDAYLQINRRAWPLMRKRGAVRMVETWAEDLQPGKQTDFLRAVDAQDGEAVSFGWVEWPDRATSDAAWADIMQNPEEMRQTMGETPYDGKRMIFGGFEAFVADGSDKGGGYYQGFLTPVPEGNREAFEKLAHSAWEEMFRPFGCMGNFESWGDDVPRGKLTDMHRAVDAKEGEVVVMSWAGWPDRATCEEAGRKMQSAMEGQPMPDMPFDGKRMIWAGFETLFDSDRA